MNSSRTSSRFSRFRSVIVWSLPVVLAAAACAAEGTASTNGAATTVALSPTTIALSDASAANSGFCDAVAEFDATDSPGGPDEPTVEDMQAYAEVIAPMVDSMVADSPGDAVDAVAILGAAVGRAAGGDMSVNEDPALDAAIATIEQSVRDNCDVAIVDVVGADYTFDVPDRIPAGPVSFKLINEGEEFHVMLLVKAPPGVDDDVDFFTRFTNSAFSGDPAAFAEFEPYAVPGNPPVAGPGSTGTVVKVLEPGEYLYFCPIPLDFTNPESNAHFHAGMHGRFTVEG